LNTAINNNEIQRADRHKAPIAIRALATIGLSFGVVACATHAAAGIDASVPASGFQHPRLMPLYSATAGSAAVINQASATAPPAPVNTPPAAAAPAVAVDPNPAAATATDTSTSKEPELTPERGALELASGDGHMTHGYGHARSTSLHGMAVTSAGVVQGELTQQSRFGFSGNYGNVSLTHDFSEDYYSTVAVGTGNSPLFPSWRVDATGYRKFGKERQYVAGIGGYYAKGNESARSDRGLLLTGIAYFTDLVVEGGVRLNWADPGTILGPSQYIAATFGNDDRRAIIVRYEHAKETYKVLPGGPALVNFKSNTASVQWRQRITRDGLLLAGLEYYQSPLYDRLSFNLGWRWSFR